MKLSQLKNIVKDAVKKSILSGINVAITTHSDAEEYTANNKPPSKYIIGEDLVNALLHYHFAPNLVSKIFICAPLNSTNLSINGNTP